MRHLPKHPLIKESTRANVIRKAISDGASLAAAWRFETSSDLQSLLLEGDVWYKMFIDGCNDKWVDFGRGNYNLSFDHPENWENAWSQILSRQPRLRVVYDHTKLIDKAIKGSIGRLARHELRIESGDCPPYHPRDIKCIDDFHLDGSSLRRTTERLMWNIAGITTGGTLDDKDFSFYNNMLFWVGDRERGLLHNRRLDGRPRILYVPYIWAWR